MVPPRIHLHRIGSDAEFLFVTEADFGFSIVPASTVLGTNKTKTAASFIGVDSRPILGELRPNPCRNVKAHLYELAFGLDAADTYLRTYKPNVRILAYPALGGETLGGHVHVSFFVESPVLVKCQKAGYTLSAQGALQRIAADAPPTLSVGLNDEFHHATVNNEVMTPLSWGKVMHWFLLPFENWIQPWTAREARNSVYGGQHSPDVVRIGPSKAPARVIGGSEWLDRSAYLHFEYRLPSTWLHHPSLAYTYLALAKLTTLNFRHVVSAYSKYKTKLSAQPDDDPGFHNYKQMPPAKNDTYAKLLQERLDALYQDTPRLTPDLAALRRAVEQCGTMRREWFYNPGPIDITAWRKLLIQ